MYFHVHDFEMLFFFLIFFTSERGSISLFLIDTFLGNLFPIKRPLWDKLSTRNHSQVMMLVGDLYKSTSWSGKLVGFKQTSLLSCVHWVESGCTFCQSWRCNLRNKSLSIRYVAIIKVSLKHARLYMLR